MAVTDLTNPQLAAFIANYRKAGMTTGGKYTLAELLLEERRRSPSAFTPVEVARRIMAGAKASDDGRVTYLEIWQAFRPGEEWKGNASVKIVGGSLGRVVEYCIRNGLPIFSVLVVPTGTRKLTDQAIQNIYNECRELGVDTGIDAEAFIRREEARALAFVAQDLPRDELTPQ